MDSLARDAVLYTFPLFEMARSRATMCPRRDAAGRPAGDSADSTWRWVNELVHSRKLLGPANRQVVTPNNDTLYTSAWLDLEHGPLLIEVPDFDERYYVLGLLDFWTNPFDAIGTRCTGNRAGRFLLHLADLIPDAPAGVTRIACPTPVVWMIGRRVVGGADDLPRVHALQDAIRLTRADGTPAAQRFDAGRPGRADADAPADYAALVNVAFAQARPPAAERERAARFADLGLCVPPQQGAPSAAAQARLSEALRGLLVELAQPQPSQLGGGWFLSLDVQSSYGEDYLLRARVARNFIGALGVQEAMYITADRDADDRPLDGSARYELRFAAGGLPQTGAFWSITLYDKPDCMLVDNPLGRYSIGDRSPQLRHDRDGGLGLWFGAEPPADPAQRDNWLPAPVGPFYLTLRLYLPSAAHLGRTFVYPALRRC